MTGKELSDVCSEWAKIVGAAIAFLIGLKQYIIAQKWKRGEFVASQIKDFEADPKIQAALTMLDWTDRPVLLLSNKTGVTSPEIVHEHTLQLALLPHSPVDGFSDTQASIRDCFDRMLDTLVRLETFVTSDLISANELYPYIEYWVKLIAGKPKQQHQPEFYVILHHYMAQYGFLGAQKLIEGYGFDISVKDDALNQALIMAAASRLPNI
jgi:hypothetical protein